METITYKVVENPNALPYIERTDIDGKVWSIPMDESNSDYQAYLASLDEQQAALEAK